MFHNVHKVIIMCSCHADDQAGFSPSVIREHTCILRKCIDACVRVCVCVYTEKSANPRRGRPVALDIDWGGYAHG